MDVDLYECSIEAVKTFVQRLPSGVLYIKLDFQDYMWRHEDFEDDGLDFKKICLIIKEKCPHLQTLKLCHAEFFDGLSSSIDLCTQILPSVRKLGFYESSFVGWHDTEYSGVSKIEVLDVVECHVREFDIIPLSKMRSLRKLNLYGTHVNQLFFKDEIVDFLNQLKVLNVGFTEISYLSSTEATLNEIVNLEELYLCALNISETDLDLSSLALPHLKTICIRSCMEVDCEDVISLIQSCPSLENIYVEEDVADSCTRDAFFLTNRCKLKIVKANKFCDRRGNIH